MPLPRVPRAPLIQLLLQLGHYLRLLRENFKYTIDLLAIITYFLLVNAVVGSLLHFLFLFDKN